MQQAVLTRFAHAPVFPQAGAAAGGRAVRGGVFAAALLLWTLGGPAPPAAADDVRWQHLSSRTGDLPVPGTSTQQTGALVADLDRDGVNDFVLSFRQKPPALVWYRRGESGWTRSVIEPEYLTVEAGGAAHDIDGDGDLDLVFGADYQGASLWWWENPHPAHAPAQPW
jgi:hypothetical protein